MTDDDLTRRRSPTVAEKHSAEKDAGCCDACDGKGGTMSGPCWDCRGTGCAHPDPCVIPPGSSDA